MGFCEDTDLIVINNIELFGFRSYKNLGTHRIHFIMSSKCFYLIVRKFLFYIRRFVKHFSDLYFLIIATNSFAIVIIIFHT